MLDIIEFKSYAKINLFLHVLNKRADGYHDILSLLSRINLFDRITFEKSREFEVIYKGLQSNEIIDDNISQLISLLQKKNLIAKLNYRITIDKKIPIGAGLGGGSSNVATVISALIDLKVIKGNIDIISIARELGSDIEFFLYDKAALINKKGSIEKLIKIEKSHEILLVNPQFNLSTAEVFNLNTSFSPIADLNVIDPITDLQTIMANTSNSLEDSAFKLCPDISKIKKEMKKQKNLIADRMTGSGSTYFGIFEDKQACLVGEEYFKNKHPDWWTSSVNTI